MWRSISETAESNWPVLMIPAATLLPNPSRSCEPGRFERRSEPDRGLAATARYRQPGVCIASVNRPGDNVAGSAARARRPTPNSAIWCRSICRSEIALDRTHTARHRSIGGRRGREYPAQPASAMVVVDLATAITVDLISNTGAFLGERSCQGLDVCPGSARIHRSIAGSP